MPERYGIAESKLYVILDDESVRNTFDLLVAFLTTSDFKSVVVNAKIGYGGGDYIVTHPHLVEEKGFPDIAYFGFSRLRDCISGSYCRGKSYPPYPIPEFRPYRHGAAR